MTALLLTVVTFLVFWLIGLGLLAAVRADISCLRIALAAPALGTAVSVLPLFLLSHAGVAMNDGARPVVIALGVGSVMVLARRRSRVHRAVVPMIALCCVGLLLVGWPMLGFGFNWIANANDDMANYVLAATKLMDHGLLGPLDVEGLSKQRNYSSALQALHSDGARPGADIMLAGFASTVGRPPYELFMPMILALNLTAVCGTAALALQASRRWWAAFIAAALLLVSPLATYGVVQQLLPQVWGLGLAAALLALLMRPELHRGSGPSFRDIAPIGLLTTAIALVYVELASTLVVAYALYVGVLTARREIAARAVFRLLAPLLLLVLVALNSYVIREFQYVTGQADTGLGSSAAVPLFGYTLVPAALPAIVGLQPLAAAASTAPHLTASIFIAALLLLVVLAVSLISASRGVAAAIVLTTFALLGIVLGIKSADFGLFKLYMFAQPFLAAAVAIWLSQATRRPILWIAAAVTLLLVPIHIYHQHTYVDRSRNPVDLRHASDADLLPAFRRFTAEWRQPIISVTENPTLAKMEAASMGYRPLHFVTYDILAAFTSSFDEELRQQFVELRRRDAWEERSFDLLLPHSKERVDRFSENTRVSELLSTGRCKIIIPSGSQLVLNRRQLPEGSPTIIARDCRDLRNVVVFAASERGAGYYYSGAGKPVSFYQLERDYFHPQRTFAGFGRLTLLRVLRPSARVRLVVDFTASFRHDSRNLVPPAAAVGVTRVELPVVGRGSARVFSPALRPQMIRGQPYVLLDMGVDGRLFHENRTGLIGLYGTSVPLDPRYLTSQVRDISLVSESEYRQLGAPSVVQDFPADLADPDLEYSGIYEDGWVGEESYVFLSAGEPTRLVVRADVLDHPAQRLQVSVDGVHVFSESVKPGSLSISVPLPASPTRRRVALHWSTSVPLPAPDLRPASALLGFIGLVAPRP